MLQAKNHTRRSVMDRRSFIDRRVLNLGPLYPAQDRRTQKDRRQGWEDRAEWKPIKRLGSFPKRWYF